MLVALAYTRAPRERYEGLPCRSANIPDCPKDGDASDMTSGFTKEVSAQRSIG